MDNKNGACKGVIHENKADNKEDLYKEAVREIKERLKNVDKGVIVPRMATMAAVLHDKLPHYFWCGFYFAEENEMIIGPYQGSSACPNISYDGVCGAGAKKKDTVIVPNVHEHPGHIPCDERSNSEIVVPLIDKRGMVIAVFDVDSAELDAFDEVDEKYLKELMPLLLEDD